ncbi:jg24365, partial [Pararge aegeria aegeria]
AGVILYECLFGRAPYSSATFNELIEKIQRRAPIECCADPGQRGHLPRLPRPADETSPARAGAADIVRRLLRARVPRPGAHAFQGELQ